MNPAFNQPARPPVTRSARQPPAVYTAEEKAGRKVLSNAGGSPPVGSVPGGVPGGIPPEMQGNIPGGIPGGMPGGMEGGMPGGPGRPDPQQLPPNPGAGPGPVQGVSNQQHPPLKPPDHNAYPHGMGWDTKIRQQHSRCWLSRNRQMEALERRKAQERDQRARDSMSAICFVHIVGHGIRDAETCPL